MDKIVLSSADVETLLKWRDSNRDLVRRNAAPFKGIILEFPEANINIKAIRDGEKLTFHVWIKGSKAGKICGQQLAGGLFNEQKNTSKLNRENVQSILTVYASLMALIVYHKPEAGAVREARQNKPIKEKNGVQRSKKSGITYILRSSSSGPQVLQRGQHASPAGVFSVRGHYRRYKDGRAVWIKPYKKGTGKQNDKTYKLN